MKRILIILLCLLCIPALGQEKAFKAGLKKGRNADGYYHADLSKMAFTKDELTKYARENGYYIRNLQEGKVLQFGNYYTAVVSLDFIPISEASQNDRDLAKSDKSPIIMDANEKKMALAKAIRETSGTNGGGYYTYQDNSHAREDVIAAGETTGYFYYGRNYSTYNFLNRDCLEKYLQTKVFDNKSGAFASEGKGMVYAGRQFVPREVRWTGSLSGDSSLEGYGFGYCTMPEKENIRLYCIEGTFRNGEPVGEIRVLETTVKSLHNEARQSLSTVDIIPLKSGHRICKFALPDGKKYCAIVDNQYQNKVANVNSLSDKFIESTDIHDSGWWPTDFVEEANGLLTFRYHQKALDIDLDFNVDPEGNFVGYTDASRIRLEGKMDEIISYYDKYLSKVLNPSDAIRPFAALQQRFNYDFYSFPSNLAWTIYNKAGLQPLLESVKAQNPVKYNRFQLTCDTRELFSTTHCLEEDFKKNREERAYEFARTTRLNRGVIFQGYASLEEIGVTERTYIISHDFCKDDIAKIKANPERPSNFDATVKAIESEFDKAERWWSSVYRGANEVLNSRIRGDKQKKKDYAREMCEKCKVVGEKSTFPEGYVPEFRGIFTSDPAQSRNDGVLVLLNGETCKWKFYYDGRQKNVEVTGAYSGEYESVKEMVDDIIQKCNSKWGARAE